MGTLTREQIAQFVRDGYVVAPQCFDSQTATDLIPLFWEAAPISPSDRSGWEKKVYLVQKNFVDGPAKALWSEVGIGVLDDLVGAERYLPPQGSGWVLLNLPGFAHTPWTAPTDGWHIDGIHFHHHVHSREQGLIGLLLFTDVEPGGGGTAVNPGSHHITARILRDAEPEGLDHVELARRVGAATEGMPVVEVRGNAGDILMMHPHLYHASSANCSERVRIASNFCVTLREPMNLKRPDPADYSPVEQAIVLAISE
ncbi:MAG: hypothetical protein OHK0029_08980 [Armatimonadaceae bacterium]